MRDLINPVFQKIYDAQNALSKYIGIELLVDEAKEDAEKILAGLEEANEVLNTINSKSLVLLMYDGKTGEHKKFLLNTALQQHNEKEIQFVASQFIGISGECDGDTCKSIKQSLAEEIKGKNVECTILGHLKAVDAASKQELNQYCNEQLNGYTPEKVTDALTELINYGLVIEDSTEKNVFWCTDLGHDIDL